MLAGIFNQKYKLLALSSILLLGTLIYSNTFYSSFHFDDAIFITDNFLIRDISNLKSLWDIFPNRFIVFFTLVLNYHFNQLNVFGYHLFNLAIHLGAAILVWWFGVLIFSTPAMKGDKLFKNSKRVALFTALIFLTHPLQTESVTYIWQRCTSLVGFFYLFSICLYIKSRLLQLQDHVLSRWGAVYALSLIFAVMSMFTKENSITLPAMIILCEFYFFKPVKFSSWKYTILFLFLLPIVPILLSVPQPVSSNTGAYYFLTQLRVMVTYIRLLFIPLNQNLDYGYPVVSSLINLPSLISLVFLAAIIISAIRVFFKYRLVSFGILWFFLTLSPESSFVPLDDVIFEHRLYLPMVGFGFFLVSFIYYLFENKALKPMGVMLLIIISCYAMLTYRRNLIWKDDSTLWNDVILKSPKKARPYNNRGLAYMDRGNIIQAVSDYTRAAAINPRYADAYNNRGVAYTQQGNFTQAISDLTQAIEIKPNYIEAYNNIGITYYQQGNITQAFSEFNRAIEVNPNYPKAYYNRGVAYYMIKKYDLAWIDVRKAERLGFVIHPEFLKELKEASGRGK